MKYIRQYLCLFILLSTAAVGAVDDPTVAGNTAFALDLYGELREEEGNLFFSPYSVSTALAMTYGGAGGNTALQMAKTMHFELPQAELHRAIAAAHARIARIEKKGNIELSVANSLWPQEGSPPLPAYVDLCKKYYGTTVTPLDFVSATESARKTINAWAEGKTKGKITDLIERGMLNALTRLVLVNAIYFKGDWASRFVPNATVRQPFHLSAGTSVEASLMHQKQELGYGEVDDLQVLELPYAGNDLSMIVLLPRRLDGLADIEAKLTARNLATWIGSLRSRKVDVFFPRFKVTSQLGLTKNLYALGMTDAFIDGVADFSGINGKRALFIEAVVHQARVEVNEEGTEAAAATAVIMGIRSTAVPMPVFRADHPFLFLIRDNASGSILFFGRISDPTK